MSPLSAEQEFIFKWQYRALGNFETALIEAIKLADDTNLLRLHLGFPTEVEGYRLYSEVDGWWPETQRQAREAGWLNG